MCKSVSARVGFESGFRRGIRRYEWYHNGLDAVLCLLERVLSGQVFQNLPSDHVWPGSSAQPERGRWNRRRTTWVTSACPLPSTPPAVQQENVGFILRRLLYCVCTGGDLQYVKSLMSVYSVSCYLYSMCVSFDQHHCHFHIVRNCGCHLCQLVPK